MADISIANLPAFLGASVLSTDLAPFVDVADTSESPLGTTKRFTFQQLMGSYTGNSRINGALFVGTPTLSGGTLSAQAADGQGYLLFIRPSGAAQWGFYSDGSGDLLLYNVPLGTTALTAVAANNAVSFANAVQLSVGQQVQWGGPTDAITVSAPGVMRFYISNANEMSLTLNSLGVGVPVVIGTDPGGADLLRVGGTGRMTGPFLIGTDPGGAESLRVGTARIGALAVNGTLNVGGLATFTGGMTLGGVITAGGFTATTQATAAIALNTGQTQFTLLSGQSLALATNGNGHGVFYIGINTLGCLAAYHNTVMTIIWQTGGFSVTPGQAGTINLWYGSGPMVENLIGIDATVHVINMAA